MQHNYARSARAVLFAVVIALGGASPAFAASTSSSTTESLEVTASISLTGIPASLSYSSVNAGATASAPEFTAQVISNHSAGWSLSIDASNLTAGGNTIPNTAREFVCAGNFANFQCTGGGSPVAYPGSPWVIGSRATGGMADIFITSRINVPGNTAPGLYTGSAVFTASTN